MNNIKYKEIQFEVKIKEKTDKDTIKELYSIIEKQNTEITNLKIEISDLKKDVQDLLDFKRKIEKMDYNNNSNNSFWVNSNIIKNNVDYLENLRNWINPNKSLKSGLLYRLSRDGDSPETFYKLCEHASPAIILTESLDGNIFGVYTTIDFAHKGKAIDKETFLFSLSKYQKFDKKKEYINDIDLINSKNGPNFGGGDFWFSNTMKKYHSNTSYFFLPQDFLPNQVELKELEVFRIFVN